MSRKNIENKTKDFIEKSILVHGDKYDYSLTTVINSKTKVTIICPEHGKFTKLKHQHLVGQGCKICSGSKLNSENFIKKANKIHNNKYDYSLVKYKNAKSKVKIICPEHGVFKQNINTHLSNKGCPICNSSKGEKMILSILRKNKIFFTTQQTFEALKNPLTNKKLKFDFYLTNLNCCIEYDGKQHFEPIEFFGGVKSFNNRKYRDGLKDSYCEENNIDLIRIPYWELENIEKIIERYVEQQTE